MKPTSETTSLFANFGKLFIGLVFVQFINFFFSLILPKYIQPTAFAEFGIFLSIIYILTEIINAKIDMAVFLGKSVEEAQQIANAAIGIACILFCFLLVISAISFFFVPVIFITIPFVVLLYGIHQPIIAFLNKQEKYNIINYFRIIQVILTASATLILAMQHIEHALIYGFLFGLACATLYSKFYIKFSFNQEEIKKIWKQFSQFPKFGIWSSLLNNVSRNSIPLLMSPFFSMSNIGFYTYATRLLNAPTGSFSSALSQVYFKKASELNGKELLQTTKNTILFSFIIGIIPSLIILFFGKDIFFFLFSSEWMEAGKIAQYLILWYFTGIIISPISSLLDIKYLLKFEFNFNLVLLLARFSAILIGGLFDQFYLAILLFAIVGVLANLGLLYYIYFRILRDDIRSASR
ncbi:MAG: oligosaccharide flippase family protein [Chitinophagales bacterium]